jgi:dihydroorotase
MNPILIRGARILGNESRDILVVDGIIRPIEDVNGSAVREIDASGLIALPGLVDLHTHLREPGGEGSETVLSGSQAAAAGGYTAVHAMANTNPVSDTAALVNRVFDLGASAGYVTVRPIGAVTKNLDGAQLADIGSMALSRAKVRVFSDDGKCVSNSALMRRALEYVATFGGVIAQHAQDPELTVGSQMHEGVVSSELGLRGWPSVAEESIIARDVLLAESVGARLHICHVSTAGAVDVLRWAKRRGIAVTAEVTPHHLLLTDDSARGYSPLFKVNPPLRTAEDVIAVREGLVDGTIDIVATDHAPHSASAKDCTWSDGAFGMVGLESALPVMTHALVETGLMTWADIARVASTVPARIGGLSEYSTPLAIGSVANITLVDPSSHGAWSSERLSGKSSNTPFTGIELPGRIVSTIHKGTETVIDGKVVTPEELARR